MEYIVSVYEEDYGYHEEVVQNISGVIFKDNTLTIRGTTIYNIHYSYSFYNITNYEIINK